MDRYSSGTMVDLHKYCFETFSEENVETETQTDNKNNRGLVCIGGGWCLFDPVVFLWHRYRSVFLFYDLVCRYSGVFRWKALGKTKLLPEISPGKTVAGLYGALAVTILYAIVACQILGLGTQRTMDFILLSLLTVMFSVNGDLFESLVKRWRGVKDSGRILPGHGGILDRIDSLIGAVPIFYLGLVLMSENYL